MNTAAIILIEIFSWMHVKWISHGVSIFLLEIIKQLLIVVHHFYNSTSSL